MSSIEALVEHPERNHMPIGPNGGPPAPAAGGHPQSEAGRRTPTRIWAPLSYAPVKDCCEFLIGVALLVSFSPVIVVAALLVKITSAGPAFYSQTRVGRDGRLFRIHKLRTMWHDCEKKTGARWATKNDSRVTPIGRTLRRMHIDELPQLWNLLKGEMSLVGPRPERPEFIPGLEAEIPHYRERLAVKPGITGLAQIHLPPDTDLDSVRRKLEHDRYYIGAMSLWLDVRLMFCTGLKMFGLPCQRTSRFLGVPATREIESRCPKLKVEGDSHGPADSVPIPCR